MTHGSLKTTQRLRNRPIARRASTWLVATCGLAAASVFGGLPARAADFTMKFAVPAANDPEENIALACKRAVESATNGRVAVQVFNRGQLGSQRAVIEGLQTGTVEAAVGSVDFYAGLDPRMGVFSFPLLFKDRPHANRVLAADKELVDSILSTLDAKGVVGGLIYSQFDGRYMSRRSIKSLADFNGKKMRINGTDAERERFSRLGVSSVAMNLPDMVQALQTGVIDGSMSGMNIWISFKLETVSKDLLIAEDTLLFSYLGFSKAWLDKLPPDLAQKTVLACRGLFSEAVKLADDFNVTLARTWEERGGVFNRLSPADKATMTAKLESVGETVSEGKPEVRAFYNRMKEAAAKVE